MGLDEAEAAAVTDRPGTSETILGMANVGPPRDPVEEWERRVRWQFGNLRSFAEDTGIILGRADIPDPLPGYKPGMEVECYLQEAHLRVWKATFPGQSGFGPAGYSTPFGYLRRLRLSNVIFGDDVQFEGIWPRKDGPSIVTSQTYILPDPLSGIPTEVEVETYMQSLKFNWSASDNGWKRERDGVLVQDCHPRNYIKTIDDEVIAIDVQPKLLPDFAFENVLSPDKI
ncbi:MAG: hypothetical protein AAF226_16100 [Verrucomicrobiota bacterium]